MGMLRIEVRGSFPEFAFEVSAMEHGHAVAVDDAIKALEGFMEAAVRRDLSLRVKGSQPQDRFHEADARSLLEKPDAD